jgi:lactate dehydrogenase-like 2-hydroxyacid dehydrogenase
LTRPDILQIGAYPAWDMEALESRFVLHRYFEAENKAAFLAERGDKIRAIATRGELGASAELIAALPRLEIISVYGVGYDAVDLPAARARGIHVTNTPDVLTGDVADLAVAMMLAERRGLHHADAWARSGDWVAKGGFALRRRVFGGKAGILGLGRIGEAVARRLAGFDMEIAYTNRAPRADAPPNWRFVADPVALARDVDVLFITLTGGPATRGIVGREVIEALGPDGLLVNVSRASNIDEAALLDALEDGRLGGAALDVFENEPRLDPRFAALPNVLLQPHHGSATTDTRKAMGRLVFDNLAAHFDGKPLPTPVLS